MQALMQQLVNLAQRISNQFRYFAILFCMLVLIFLGVDLIYDITSYLSFRTLSKLGKGFGSIAIFFVMLAALYYVCRELYVRWQRRQGMLFTSITVYGKSMIQIMRLLHPLFGLLAIVFSLLHFYILWVHVLHYQFNVTIGFGISAFFILLLIALSGKGVQSRYQISGLRYKHRWLAIFFFVLYFIHISS